MMYDIILIYCLACYYSVVIGVGLAAFSNMKSGKVITDKIMMEMIIFMTFAPITAPFSMGFGIGDSFKKKAND